MFPPRIPLLNGALVQLIYSIHWETNPFNISLTTDSTKIDFDLESANIWNPYEIFNRRGIWG